MIGSDASGHSDIGKVRKANEDSFFLEPSIGLYVVADGMGGHRGGAIASQLAVKTMRAYMANVYRNGLALEHSTEGDTSNGGAKHLLYSIALANKQIYTRSIKDKSCRGMGTTISALFLCGDLMIAANVGDSPIYLFREGERQDLYTPHTLLNERKSVLKSMEGRYPPAKWAHILTRAVGIRQRVRVDHVTMPVQSKDIVVLCSDGLSGKVSQEEIGALVDEYNPEAACKMLTDLALERGGQDNITVIVVKITSTIDKTKMGLFRRLIAFPTWLRALCKSKRQQNQQ
jgi:protein phosphatase